MWDYITHTVSVLVLLERRWRQIQMWNFVRLGNSEALALTPIQTTCCQFYSLGTKELKNIKTYLWHSIDPMCPFKTRIFTYSIYHSLFPNWGGSRSSLWPALWSGEWHPVSSAEGMGHSTRLRASDLESPDHLMRSILHSPLSGMSALPFVRITFWLKYLGPMEENVVWITKPRLAAIAHGPNPALCHFNK